MKTICICVCTRNRPVMLAECLASIHPTRQKRVSDDVAIRYVVVDNASTEATRALTTVMRILPEAWLVRTAKPGLTVARNAALKAALDLDADWIAFIDDDEVAAPDWLHALYWEAERWNADAVHGSIKYQFPADAPAWRRKAPWADWAGEDGHVLDSAGTGNVLFSADVVRYGRLQFPQACNMGGGEDGVFFRHFHEAGGRIVFSSLPLVRETVPWSRITLAGFARKAHRNGALKVQTARLNGKFKRKRYIRKAAARVVTGVARVALAAPAFLVGWSMPVLSSGLNDLAEAAGIIKAVRGSMPTYYAKTDGF